MKICKIGLQKFASLRKNFGKFSLTSALCVYVNGQTLILLL